MLISSKTVHIPLESWPPLQRVGAARKDSRAAMGRKQWFLQEKLFYLTKNSLCLLMTESTLLPEEKGLLYRDDRMQGSPSFHIMQQRRGTGIWAGEGKKDWNTFHNTSSEDG